MTNPGQESLEERLVYQAGQVESERLRETLATARRDQVLAVLRLAAALCRGLQKSTLFLVETEPRTTDYLTQAALMIRRAVIHEYGVQLDVE